MTMKTEQSTLAQIQEAMTSDAIPHVYFNGFSCAVGAGDVVVVLTRHEQAVATLNVSYTVAKTLAQNLSLAVSELERLTGNQIMTVDDIKSKIQPTSNEAQ